MGHRTDHSFHMDCKFDQFVDFTLPNFILVLVKPLISTQPDVKHQLATHRFLLQ